MARTRQLRTLVVDGEEETRLGLKALLSQEGFNVTTVTGSHDALLEVKEGRYQIVLLSLEMPDVDGISLLHQIRALDSELCVITMTRSPSIEHAVETMKADAFDYLRKPFPAESLHQVLQRAMREKGLASDPEEHLNRQIGQRLRQLRKQHGLTLRQLGAKTALSVSLISQIELGKSAASVTTLRRLSLALGVSLADLFEGI